MNYDLGPMVQWKGQREQTRQIILHIPGLYYIFLVIEIIMRLWILKYLINWYNGYISCH